MTRSLALLIGSTLLLTVMVIAESDYVSTRIGYINAMTDMTTMESAHLDQMLCLERCTAAILDNCDDHIGGSSCQHEANFRCDDICQVTYPQ